ncbi:hypothetical protein FV242_18245 [Methylobacterium sp. WL64]|uniref:hypothetical protein n=1 Tax=Methylobacterium sp. WL64 TaxID=2603894 RepID=UPI0011C89F18|nr:hypothetical protein [Methylobacterium sp. WL64]TXN01546.1 hypothetical protein FV242_18245 [Methylobacterium sp. WL64]
MSALRAPTVGLVLYMLSIGLVSAQPDTSGTGGGSPSTERVPNIPDVGHTKPSSRDASPTSVKAIERPTSRQAVDDAISAKVCRGCGVDPNTTGSIPVTASTAGAPERRDIQLDELRTATEPRQQSGLDTFALASAHREQAKSAAEKTDGLWQSWVVSVCKGCGDQKPAKAFKLEDWPNRDVPMITGSVDRNLPLGKARSIEAKRAEIPRRGSLEADLSPGNLASIKGMPRE